jgi:hypothetical protein
MLFRRKNRTKSTVLPWSGAWGCQIRGVRWNLWTLPTVCCEGWRLFWRPIKLICLYLLFCFLVPFTELFITPLIYTNIRYIWINKVHTIHVWQCREKRCFFLSLTSFNDQYSSNIGWLGLKFLSRIRWNIQGLNSRVFHWNLKGKFRFILCFAPHCDFKKHILS